MLANPIIPLQNASPAMEGEASLRISEIFYSLQGEASTSGLPTVFVRLTGCPLRCTYCDTAYAFEGGQRKSLTAIVAAVEAYGVTHVCITGGEPLAQPNCLPLLTLLCNAGQQVSLETSGALDIGGVDPRVSCVMDLKTPSSGEDDKNLWHNIKHLKAKDQIKFVIANSEDYAWAKNIVRKHQLASITNAIWFSPVFAIDSQTVGVPPIATALAQWIINDKLPVRLALQLHKLLWQDARGK